MPVWFCNFTHDDSEKHSQYVNLTKMSHLLKHEHRAIHLNGNGQNFEMHYLDFLHQLTGWTDEGGKMKPSE